MKVCKIKDIGIIGTGTTPSMKNKEFYDSDDIMFIKPSDFIDNRITELSSSISYISNKSREKARIFPAGTVLCTCIGNIGKIAIVSKEASCNQQNNYIIPYKEFDSKYVAYSLLSQRKKMESIGANAPIVPIINKTEFSNIEIPVYDSSTQIKIAHHLDTIQSAIDNKQQQLKELDEFVKSRFIEMFGEIELNSEKKEWIKLKDISKIFTGTTPSTSVASNWNGDILWITPAEITKESLYVYDTERKITEKGRKSKSLDIMPPGTVLLSTRAPIGKVAIVGKPMTCNQGFKNFYCNKNKIHPIYLYEIFNYNTEFLNSKGTGTTFKELSKSNAEQIKIPVPPLDLQNQFASFVKQIDKSKFVVKQQIKDLQELLDSKMQEYFS